MELKYGRQIELNEIESKTIHLFLFACNHEKRVYSVYNNIAQKNNITKAVGLCYKSPSKAVSQGINLIAIKNHTEIYNLLDKELSKATGDEVNILVDYSCMTKSWYYSIILYLSKRDTSLKLLVAYFIYTPSKFSKPHKPKYNTDIAPLPGKYVVPTNKPKALIVCLGYEQKKAEGIIDHLDPKVCYLFYTKPTFDPLFVATIEDNNKDVLDYYSNVVTFPFNDLLFLERQLTSLYYLLKDDYSVIIAPLGPKPFTFIAMLLSVRFPDIDIWRVGSGSDINRYKREPISDDLFLIHEVVFQATEEVN
ncbi:hypothetical protein [Mucilaginibacter jinjuensis]|uniref:Uncharacterized protein n=1 Tax=Mucilaginibacter jinjuensis TaxID=1176721 RepID=A0ABY7T8K8_9SPHI|nr:hypothetical protein [Mucilaginibacter jinjuensis]WCT11557.1 hypothetical protein PQO05_22720 [Mucilaginibacter jinjuensis]